MKNKGLTYFLLIVVGVIWYQVFFRIKSNLENTELPVNRADSRQLSQNAFARDTFVLQAGYRDPFGGKIHVQPSGEDFTPQIQPDKPKIQKPVISEQPWVKIRYYGLIKKTDSKNPLALLNIDNEQFSLHKGEEVFDGYKILAIYRDSVLISYGKKSRYFYKK